MKELAGVKELVSCSILWYQAKVITVGLIVAVRKYHIARYARLFGVIIQLRLTQNYHWSPPIVRHPPF
jgi:hypothetical protein